MSKGLEKAVDMQVGGSTVAENLEQAIRAGKLIETAEGKLRLAREAVEQAEWLIVANGPNLACAFLMGFLFEHAYGRAAVPHGCRACYKVKATPRTLRELVAGWRIAKGIRFRSKWGIDLNNPYSQNIYAGFFYTVGLDQARALYKNVRKAFDADPNLGPNVPLMIKRGCSEYEIEVGPSDRYEFSEEMSALEKKLKGRFEKVSKPGNPSQVLARLIDLAYRIGDDTYLDFTEGRPRRAKTLTYDPNS